MGPNTPAGNSLGFSWPIKNRIPNPGIRVSDVGLWKISEFGLQKTPLFLINLRLSSSGCRPSKILEVQVESSAALMVQFFPAAYPLFYDTDLFRNFNRFPHCGFRFMGNIWRYCEVLSQARSKFRAFRGSYAEYFIPFPLFRVR